MVSLVWMIAAAYLPDYFRLLSLDAEIVILVALLVTALLSVSVIALRHTRLPDESEARASHPPD